MVIQNKRRVKDSLQNARQYQFPQDQRHKAFLGLVRMGCFEAYLRPSAFRLPFFHSLGDAHGCDKIVRGRGSENRGQEVGKQVAGEFVEAGINN